jgi:uncharacterized protein (TIGR02284 family)
MVFLGKSLGEAGYDSLNINMTDASPGIRRMACIPASTSNVFIFCERLLWRSSMNSEETISILKELIRTCKDGEEGFKTCALDASDRHPQLKTVFEERQRDCANAVTELQNLAQVQGGNPPVTLSVGAALHRGWLNIKTALAGKNDAAVLDECERAENEAAEVYRKALGMDLPADVRMVVERQ